MCLLIFDDIITDGDIYSADLLLDKSKNRHENILVYNISCKTSTGPKLLRITFNKIDGL